MAILTKDALLGLQPRKRVVLTGEDWGGSELVLEEMSAGQRNDIFARQVNAQKNGTPFDVEAEMIAATLRDPRLTVEDAKNLSPSVADKLFRAISDLNVTSAEAVEAERGK